MRKLVSGMSLLPEDGVGGVPLCSQGLGSEGAHRHLQNFLQSLRQAQKGFNQGLSSKGGPGCSAPLLCPSHACSSAHRCITGEMGLLKHSAAVFQVTAFCDVDEKKITKGFYTYEESEVSYKHSGILYCDLEVSWGMWWRNLSLIL